MILKINLKIVAGILGVLLLIASIPIGMRTISASTDHTITSEENTVELPILMYHHMLKSSKLLGNYMITPTEFENDLKYLKNNGYTTIQVRDLIAFCNGEAPLPEKPVMITFDDGYESVYAYAYPLLQQYGMKAVVSIIGYYTDLYSKTEDKHLNYSHLTWTELREMTESGTFEIQNHTYNMHGDNTRKGLRKKSGESEEEYRSAISADLIQVQNEVKTNLGILPTAFTYPFGYITKTSKEIVKDLGFQASFSCEEGINVLSGNPEELYLLMRYNRVHNQSTESFMNKVLNGKRRKPIPKTTENSPPVSSNS